MSTTHALRAQLRSLRLRLLGDLLRAERPQRWTQDRTCLHLGRVSFHHPGRRSRITITSPPLEDFSRVLNGSVGIVRPLHAALARRLPCLIQPDLDSYRLLTGDAEDVPGLFAERYGPMAVFQLTQDREKLSSSLRDIARWYREMLGVHSVYVKRNIKSARPALREEITDLKPLIGKPVPQQFEINEHGIRFAIRPFGGLSVGLFLDHRENRQRIRSLAGGRDVLNLFAYTCGFSVAAALGTAKATVSVDLSPKSLEWGRLNFTLNGLDPNVHEFVQAGAFDYLHRAREQGRSFDLVILDPPSFAHGRRKGEDFQVARDLPELVAAASGVLRCGGILMVSTNLRRLPPSGLRELVRHGLRGRRFKITDMPALPVDFAIDPDHAKAVFIEVGEARTRGTEVTALLAR